MVLCSEANCTGWSATVTTWLSMFCYQIKARRSLRWVATPERTIWTTYLPTLHCHDLCTISPPHTSPPTNDPTGSHSLRKPRDRTCGPILCGWLLQEKARNSTQWPVAQQTRWPRVPRETAEVLEYLQIVSSGVKGHNCHSLEWQLWPFSPRGDEYRLQDATDKTAGFICCSSVVCTR